MNEPEFLGYIGVNMNDLEYYKVKESARKASKCHPEIILILSPGQNDKLCQKLLAQSSLPI